MSPETLLFWGLFHFVAQAGLKLLTSRLAQLPEFLYYRDEYDPQPRENSSRYLLEAFLSYHICFPCPLNTYVPCPV